MSSQHVSKIRNVGNCHDGKWTDAGFCHSDQLKVKDKDPWLVFGYRADASP